MAQLMPLTVSQETYDKQPHLCILRVWFRFRIGSDETLNHGPDLYHVTDHLVDHWASPTPQHERRLTHDYLEANPPNYQFEQGGRHHPFLL